MKRAGFTMIELIFVIVILGILAAVAIPKLAATRTDAGVSKMASNLSTVVSDLGAYWTANGAWPGTFQNVTNVPLYTAAGGATAATTISTTANTTGWLNAVANTTADATDGCYSVVLTIDGNITVSSPTAGTDPVCVGAKTATDTNNISSTAGVTTSFGGTGVSY